MCFRELLDSLAAKGLKVTPAQVRWALMTGKVSRPRLDASLRFDFSPDHVTEFLNHFDELGDHGPKAPARS